MKLLTSFLLLCLTLSCNMRQSSHSENSLSSDTIRYAQGFTMHHFDGYTAVEVRDPWDSTRLLQRYLLVDRDRPVPENLPKGTVVQVPAQNVVVYTSVHAAIIDQLGETGRIIGVCEPRYMDTPAIREGLKVGRIVDMGEATAPNVEMMIDKGAELVIVSPFQNSGYGPDILSRSWESPLSREPIIWNRCRWDVPNGFVSTGCCSVRKRWPIPFSGKRKRVISI